MIAISNFIQEKKKLEAALISRVFQATDFYHPGKTRLQLMYRNIGS